MSVKNNDLAIQTFTQLEDFKLCCKVSIIECMNNQNIQNLTKCMKACLESIEAVDVCQYFIASKSSNAKQCITFVISVLKKCIIECNKASINEHLKKVNKDTTAKAAKVFMKSLLKLKEKL